MKVKLLRQNRIDGNAGEIVEVSPARAAFLLEMNLAEQAPIRERIVTPEDNPERIVTPEDNPERIETPEKKTSAKKTKRSKK